jgi:hypothetical protein
MKALLLAATGIFMASSCAMAQERMAGEVPQPTGAAVKLAMGPTSAAHKPGGTAEETKDTPKLHKKSKHHTPQI